MNQEMKMPSRSETIMDILRLRAGTQRDEPVFAFLGNGDEETGRLSFHALDFRARAIARHLHGLARPNDRILLLYSPSLDFIEAFFGCLYAGMAPVPIKPPRRTQSLDKVAGIASDCGAAGALTDSSLFPELQGRFAEFASLREMPLACTDAIQGEQASALAADWKRPDVGKETLAFLQYTSGSTGFPKGVCVSHGNLLYNAEMTNAGFGHDANTIMAGWLPLFHDMGLVGGVMQPVYNGFLSALMPPASFLQKPMRWLKAISKYRATTSGGPNFGFELCVQKFRHEQLEGVDLSSWKVAFNGAEPVSAKTIRDFTRTFAPFGFRASMHQPCYGMAEATLIISGGDIDLDPKIRMFEAASLEQGLAVPNASESGEIPGKFRELVGCGSTMLDQEIRIVDPESLAECRDLQIGEIWIRGENVSAGYWNKTELNQSVFQARIRGGDDRRYLRTGDLGFLMGKELFVSGRLKDLVIIKGRNLFPQDLEAAIESSHPAFQAGGCAAFSIDSEFGEKLVAVQEIRREYRKTVSFPELFAAAREAIAREFDVQLADLVQIPQATLPKTSSGKTMRRRCREMYLSNQFEPPTDQGISPAESKARSNANVYNG